jgi:hypothetical protein
LIRKVWSNRQEEEILIDFNSFFKKLLLISLNNLELKVGDFKRLLLTGILGCLAIGSFYFIFTIMLLIPNQDSTTVLKYSILFFVAIGVIYLYYSLFFDSVVTTKAFFEKGYDGFNFIGYLAFLTVIILAIMSLTVFPLENYLSNPVVPHDVFIETDQEFYSPFISTTPGIGLLPTNSTNIKTFFPVYKSTAFKWNTNYGYFVVKNPYTDSLILKNNNSLVTNNDQVYWSFPKTNASTDRIPVKITLEIYYRENWTIITNSSMDITWTDQGYAKVVNYTKF